MSKDPINLTDEQIAELRNLLDSYEQGAILFVELKASVAEIFGFYAGLPTITMGSHC